MTALTPQERAVLAALPAFGSRPVFVKDHVTAAHLAHRGLAIAKPVRYANVPLFMASRKGAELLERPR